MTVDRKLTVCELFKSKYITFVDNYGPSNSNSILYCEPIGATLYNELLNHDADEFTEHVERRACLIREIMAPKIMMNDICNYLYNEIRSRNDIINLILDQKECFEAKDLIEKANSLCDEYIKDMCIEFNQVDRMNDLLQNKKTVDDVLEDLKSHYHSTWRNERDFEWIASLK